MTRNFLNVYLLGSTELYILSMSTICTSCFHSKDRHYFSEGQKSNSKHYSKVSECSCRQFREN